MRTYRALDLLRFHKLANENKDMKPFALIRLYNETFPEISKEEMLKRLLEILDRRKVKKQKK